MNAPPAHWLAVVIGAGALIAIARLLSGLLRIPPPQRPRAWRTGVLVLGTLASAGLLWALLHGRPAADSLRVVHIATEGASPTADHPQRIVLPEAGMADGEAMPDLATALRRHPGVDTLVIEGHGLLARDRDATRALRIDARPPPLPAGIVARFAPLRVRNAGMLPVEVEVHGLRGGKLELVDPGGKVVDAQVLDDAASVTLQAPVRGSGPADYLLRLRDAAGGVRDTVPVPVEVLPTAPARIALRAGGPDPELKFLRRWAADHGATLQASIALGMGMQAGDPPLPLDAASLAGIDLLVLDDRSWNGLGGGQRAAVLAAVERGLGLLLRPGAGLAGGGAAGIGTAPAPAVQLRPALAGVEPGTLPKLHRPPLRIVNPAGVTVLRDERGEPMAGWRAHGRGRIGIWLPQDSFQLALAGRQDLHGRLWSTVLWPLLRARQPRLPDLPNAVRAGGRAVLCGLEPDAAVIAPDGGRTRLAIDPRSGGARCAAWWPQAGGWHRLAMAGRTHPVPVLAADAAPVMRLAELQQATRRLAQQQMTAEPTRRREDTPSRWPGPWPLFALWLLLSAGLWWFERSRHGRR